MTRIPTPPTQISPEQPREPDVPDVAEAENEQVPRDPFTPPVANVRMFYRLYRGGGQGVPMAVRVARELELHSQRSRFTEPHDLVFPNPRTGEPQQRSEVHRRLKRTLKWAGVREELTLHGLRHTFGTRLAAAGVPLVKIQEWMGHETRRRLRSTSITSPLSRTDVSLSGHSAPTRSASTRGPFRGPICTELRTTQVIKNRVGMGKRK